MPLNEHPQNAQGYNASIGSASDFSSVSVQNIVCPQYIKLASESFFREVSEISLGGVEVTVRHSEVESVVLPTTLTYFGESTLKGFSNLTEVEIPDSVTSLNLSGLYGCSSLTSLVIPSSVTEVTADEDTRT